MPLIGWTGYIPTCMTQGVICNLNVKKTHPQKFLDIIQIESGPDAPYMHLKPGLSDHRAENTQISIII